ncbi:NAD(P)H-dependent oxidoreductase [Gordonia rubripertincta]|uniref:NAD(P)H-dependent oxidoreductase n=1 Tax=Gordonia rubripertincta TaxID=36822 RepID=UPI000B8D978A|nr:NAD(P)H-dependent oxidoreductase [Gordonia rubripertincta]ASR03489.1 Glutathione-regulated potassium-efflux system ancillary protein KefF [Gordonia rubripertincta]TSD98966.1 NAD(P)H-dependent oxidoreductase [Gordonia rubripertincta]
MRGNALWVLAHPDQSSLSSHLRNVGVAALREKGWRVTESDLYRMRWDPLLVTDDGQADVRAEQRKLADADLVVVQFPLWWYGMPAILKGWFDRVFESGFAYDVPDPETGRFLKYGRGGLIGKRALLVVTAGDRHASLGPRGISGHIDDVLWPILHGTLWYTGMQPLRPHLITEADDVDPSTVGAVERSLTDRLGHAAEEEPIAYLPMEDEFYDHSIRLHDHVSPGVEGNAAHQHCAI